MLEIVSRSTVGDDTPPSHPNITDIVGDAVRPMFLAFGTFIIGFLPSSICLIAFHSGAAAARILGLIYFNYEHRLDWFPRGRE